MTSALPEARGYDDLPAHDVTSAPTLLLLPGWCGGREVFGPALAPLAVHHRVVSTDLRGHGDLRHQDGDFDSAQQLDELVALLERLDAGRVVPVALAHAGWFAIELRRRLGPERIAGLVLVDWMPLGTPPGFMDALAGLQSPAWAEVRAALFDLWTMGVQEPAVLEYVDSMASYGAEHWGRAGREIAAAFEREGSPLQALDALDEPCPTLHVYAQPADPAYLAAQQAAAEQRPWFTVTRLDAASHFPPLEAPYALSDTITSFGAALT